MMRKKQKIDESEVMKFGFLGGIAQAVYILFFVLFIKVMSEAAPNTAPEIVGPMLFLLAFIFSAGVSGLLVFGYPIYMATQKRYMEGLATAVTTLLTIAIIAILVFMLISFL